MTPTSHSDENVSPGLPPNYIHVGIDDTGSAHCYDTRTDSVHVIQPDGTREHRVDLNADQLTIEAYVAKIDRDWDDLYVGRNAFLEKLAEAV